MADGSLEQQNGRLSGRHYLLEGYAETAPKRASNICFFGTCLDVVSLTIDFQIFAPEDVEMSIYSSKLLRKTRLVPRKHFWLYHALPTPRSEHSKGSLSKRTKRIIDRQVLRRQDTSPTLPANSLFYSSRCGLVHSHHNCWHLYLD